MTHYSYKLHYAIVTIVCITVHAIWMAPDSFSYKLKHDVTYIASILINCAIKYMNLANNWKHENFPLQSKEVLGHRYVIHFTKISNMRQWIGEENTDLVGVLLLIYSDGNRKYCNFSLATTSSYTVKKSSGFVDLRT